MIFWKNMQQLLRSMIKIQLLALFVLAGLQLVLTTNFSCPDPYLKGTFFDHLPLDNVLFTEDLLLKASAWSRVDCIQKCAQTEGCAMSSFLPSPRGGSPGHCRLHSQLQTAADGKTSVPGARSLVRRGSPCREGFGMTCGRCLKAVHEKVNYTTARQACCQLKARLLMTKSAAEVDCIWSFMNNISWYRIWIGGDDMAEARVFRWNDGPVLPDNSPLWDQQDEEPDHICPGCDCLSLRVQDSNIFDRPCDGNYTYICERDSP